MALNKTIDKLLYSLNLKNGLSDKCCVIATNDFQQDKRSHQFKKK